MLVIYNFPLKEEERAPSANDQKHQHKNDLLNY